jgi:probable rRNA maturation factor
MINLEINEGFQPKVELSPIIRAADATLNHQGIIENAELTIVITDDSKIHELNRKYRAVDAPTDVLSFPNEFTDPENQIPYLGDVIISYPRAVEQASKGGHSVEDELLLLVVHGVLHLLGHDHTDSDEKHRMWKAQDIILNRIGVDIVYD